MKAWIVRRRWLILFAIGLFSVLSYYFGYTWDLQLSTESGRQRVIHKYWGISVRTGAPEDTAISEWVGPGPQDEEWVSVAKGPVRGALVSYYFVRVFQHFHRLEYLVTDSGERRSYAVFVLRQLRERGDIGSVARGCSDVAEAIRDDIPEWGPEDEPLTSAELVALWNSNSGHDKTALPTFDSP